MEDEKQDFLFIFLRSIETKIFNNVIRFGWQFKFLFYLAFQSAPLLLLKNIIENLAKFVHFSKVSCRVDFANPNNL